MTPPATTAHPALAQRLACGTPTDWLRHHLDGYRATAAKQINGQCLEQPAIVFAPHYDDEALGCGGMIIRKRMTGAECRVVFMTDGGASHGARLDRKHLAALRREEAIAAGQVMGVVADQITTLAFPDQSLGQHAGEAIDRVTDLLDHFKPKQIWYPHMSEPRIWSSDHNATTAIVREAAARCGQQFAMFEYPVWLWFGYPWIDLAAVQQGERRAYLRSSLSGVLGLRLARECRLALDIGDVLEIKRAAVAEYRSQTGGLPDGPSLAHVANGQFLAWLLRSTEIYAEGRPPAPRAKYQRQRISG